MHRDPSVPRPRAGRERMSALDASFLHFERPGQALNVGLSGIYEGELSRADVVAAVRGCLSSVPRLSQSAVCAPLRLAQPLWQTLPDFDPELHVEIEALEPPGDERAFARAAAAAMARPLDRSRPLWRMVLVQGLAGGDTGLVLVVHHAMADLLSCFDLAAEIHRPTGTAPRRQPARSPSEGGSTLGAIPQAAYDRFADLAAWSREGLRLVARPAEAGRYATRMAEVARGGLRDWLEPAARTPFNGPLSPRRDCAWVELPLSEVETVREAVGGTVNDVALAVVCGALRGYLIDLGQAVDGLVLRLLCPASLRSSEERGVLGNRISWIAVPADLGIGDPLTRLRACREVMDGGKESGEARGRKEWLNLLRWSPPGWQEVAGRLADPSGNFNSIVTNVRGPEQGLVLAGHRARKLVPWAPLAAGMGLIHTIGSYEGGLFFNAVVDPALVPEPARYADFLRDSFAELKEAAVG